MDHPTPHAWEQFTASKLQQRNVSRSTFHNKIQLFVIAIPYRLKKITGRTGYTATLAILPDAELREID
jgi:hypothetical protein